MAVNPIPEGYNTVTPSLIVEDANGMLQFLTKAFDCQRALSDGRPRRQDCPRRDCHR